MSNTNDLFTQLFYPDNTLYFCPECNAIGKISQNIFGKEMFFHKIPSPRLEGYYTFTADHQN